MGQNFGSVEASFYSDAIQGINIAAGASVYMGRKTNMSDHNADWIEANEIHDAG
jgi:hypothetical protein